MRKGTRMLQGKCTNVLEETFSETLSKDLTSGFRAVD